MSNDSIIDVPTEEVKPAAAKPEVLAFSADLAYWEGLVAVLSKLPLETSIGYVADLNKAIAEAKSKAG